MTNEELRGSRDIDNRTTALQEALRVERSQRRRWPNFAAVPSLPLVITGWFLIGYDGSGAQPAAGAGLTLAGYILGLLGLLSSRSLYRAMAGLALAFGLPLLPIFFFFS